jgi:hypothetical protein
MKTHLIGKVSITALFVLTGCGEGVDVVGSTDESAPTTPSEKHENQASNGAVSAPAALVSVSGFTHDADGAPLSAVKVCLQAGPTVAMDIGECATSEPDGSFTLHGVPANMLVTIGFEKDGFAPAIRAIQTESSDVQIPADENSLLAESTPPVFAGAPMDPNTGAIEFFVGSEGADAPVAVSLFSIENGVHEPVYLGEDGKPQSGATSGSFGGFVNLPAGMYIATFKSPSGSCTTAGSLYGYPMSAYQQPGETGTVVLVEVPVSSGRITTPVGVSCTGASVATGR